MKASRKLYILQHATAIRSVRLRHIGLAPVHDGKARIVAAVPIDPTAEISEELDYAIDAALSYWPDCTDWSILNCDEVSSSDTSPIGI